MQIYKNNQHHFPVFSPYSHHKHLPHDPHQGLAASLERKKLTKHGVVLEAAMKQVQAKHPQRLNVKELIIDEIEKKKMLAKQSHELAHGHNQQFSQIQKVQKQKYGLDLRQQKQRQEHNQISGNYHNGTSIHNPEIQPYHASYLSMSGYSSSHYHSTHFNASSQTIANGLKIELEILKQQLDDKNRRVVDLELQLMQIKNGFFDKEHKKDDQEQLSTTTKSRFYSQDNRKDVVPYQDKQCQTFCYGINLTFSSSIINEMVQPNHAFTTTRDQQLVNNKKLIQKLQKKLAVQQQAMKNFFQDIQMYQTLNQQLQERIKALQQQKNNN